MSSNTTDEKEEVGTDVVTGYPSLCSIIMGPPWPLFNYLLLTLANTPVVRALPIRLAPTPGTTRKLIWAIPPATVLLCFFCIKTYRRYRSRNNTETNTDDSGEVRVALYAKPPDPPRRNQGLAGIRNQGTTCYLNCLLQALVHTPEFREFLAQLKEGGEMEDLLNKEVLIITIKLSALTEEEANLEELTAGAQLTQLTLRSTRKGLEAELKQLEHNKRQVTGKLTSVDRKKKKLEESDDKQQQVIGTISSANEKRKKLTDKLKELDDEQRQVTGKLSSVNERKKRVDVNLEELRDKQREGTEELSSVDEREKGVDASLEELGDKQRQGTGDLSSFGDKNTPPVLELEVNMKLSPVGGSKTEVDASQEQLEDKQRQVTDNLSSVGGEKTHLIDSQRELENEQQQVTGKLSSVDERKEGGDASSEGLGDKQRQGTDKLSDVVDQGNHSVEDPKKLENKQWQMADKPPCVEETEEMSASLEESVDEQRQMTGEHLDVDESMTESNASPKELGEAQNGEPPVGDEMRTSLIENQKGLENEQLQAAEELTSVRDEKTPPDNNLEASMDEQKPVNDKLPIDGEEKTRLVENQREVEIEKQQETEDPPSARYAKTHLVDNQGELEEKTHLVDNQEELRGKQQPGTDMRPIAGDKETHPVDNQEESEEKQHQVTDLRLMDGEEKTHLADNQKELENEQKQNQQSTLKAALEQESDQLTHKLKGLEPKRRKLTDQLNSTEKNLSNLMGRLTAMGREKQESKEAATKLSQDRVKLTNDLMDLGEQHSQLKERLGLVKGEEKGLVDTLETVRKFHRELKDKENMLLDSKEAVTKLRGVPIEFHELIESIFDPDQRSCSSKGLTDSLNWGTDKTHVQHDVQELYRSLLGTLEESLEGTSKEKAISDLYHGSVINKITCQKCHIVNEREEDFVDLTLPITGMGHVSDSLEAMYQTPEFMSGDDQYWCNQCQALVDAEKCTRVRKLPQILALSLLRFNYDFRSHRRSKDARHYKFERELNMEQYCDQDLPANISHQDDVYELFAVIIHGGDAEGGHYHSYIKVDANGYEQPENDDQPNDKSSSGAQRRTSENWFDFNDSRVSAIPDNKIDTQFQGYESAYMLFYRRMTRPAGGSEEKESETHPQGEPRRWEWRRSFERIREYLTRICSFHSG